MAIIKSILFFCGVCGAVAVFFLWLWSVTLFVLSLVSLCLFLVRLCIRRVSVTVVFVYPSYPFHPCTKCMTLSFFPVSLSLYLGFFLSLDVTLAMCSCVRGTRRGRQHRHGTASTQ